jgi:group I intron endonuclease
MNKLESINYLKNYNWNGLNVSPSSFPLVMSNNKMMLKWNSTTSGIYVWINKINNKMYVGRANNLYRRVYEEKRAFKNGKHENLKKLFNAVNKYGIQNFNVHQLILVADKSKLINLEECFIAYYNTKHNGYNCTYGGDGCCGHIVSEEQKKKQKEKMKVYWTEEKCKEHVNKMKFWFNGQPSNAQEKIRAGNKWWENKEYKKKHLQNTQKSLTAERIKKQKMSLLNYYKNHISKRAISVSVITPFGVTKNVNGTYKFCLNNHIEYKNFMRMVRNEIPEYKGWKLVSK